MPDYPSELDPARRPAPAFRHAETLAVHAGHDVDPGSGAVVPPLILSTTFQRGPDGTYARGFVYSRTDNPNRQALERCLALLEGGPAAAAFSSGMAATTSVFQALDAGSHVILPEDVYFGTAQLVRDLFARWGLQYCQVDMTDLEAVQRNIQPNTALIWVETPSNPQLKVTDIQSVAQIAHGVDAICVCDNTWATPILQRPFDWQVDLVVHSTTKYLGGHSDLMGGAVVARRDDDRFARIRQFQTVGGAIPSPFDCWLLLRSIQTLPQRMQAHCRGASIVAQYLQDHPAVERVHYPGLAHHSGHEVARRQMADFGGMLSVQIRDRAQAALAMAMAGRLRVFTQATSLGGVESLVEHRASVEGPNSKTPQNLLRLSIGLEHPDDLVADLDQALTVLTYT